MGRTEKGFLGVESGFSQDPVDYAIRVTGAATQVVRIDASAEVWILHEYAPAVRDQWAWPSGFVVENSIAKRLDR